MKNIPPFILLDRKKKLFSLDAGFSWSKLRGSSVNVRFTFNLGELCMSKSDYLIKSAALSCPGVLDLAPLSVRCPDMLFTLYNFIIILNFPAPCNSGPVLNFQDYPYPFWTFTTTLRQALLSRALLPLHLPCGPLMPCFVVNKKVKVMPILFISLSICYSYH